MKNSVFDRQKSEDSRIAELKKLANALQRTIETNPAPQSVSEKPAQ